MRQSGYKPGRALITMTTKSPFVLPPSTLAERIENGLAPEPKRRLSIILHAILANWYSYAKLGTLQHSTYTNILRRNLRECGNCYYTNMDGHTWLWQRAGRRIIEVRHTASNIAIRVSIE